MGSKIGRRVLRKPRNVGGSQEQLSVCGIVGGRRLTLREGGGKKKKARGLHIFSRHPDLP